MAVRKSKIKKPVRPRPKAKFTVGFRFGGSFILPEHEPQIMHPGDAGEPITGGPKGLSGGSVDVYSLITKDGKQHDIQVVVSALTPSSQLRVTLIGDDGVHFDVATPERWAALLAQKTKNATLEVRSLVPKSTYSASTWGDLPMLVDPPPPD